MHSKPGFTPAGPTLALIAALSGITANAAEMPTLAPVQVIDSETDRTGIAGSASEGLVTREQINARPTYRSGEILEFAPGLIVTQHSGDGKANQYFLRGFNLDHGTDLAITVDGMPVNLRSHGHGQGYSDLNFLIPELVSGLYYKKGPYYADEGDFAAAGAVHINILNRAENSLGEIGAGGNGYRRALLAGSPALGDGHLLYGLELQHNDGPWSRPDDFGKLNALLRYHGGTAQNGWNITAMAYKGDWNSTDQIPQRAISSGQLGRYDGVDNTDGGNARRYSLSGAWRRSAGGEVTEANAYVVQSRLNLYSNFTYFLNDPVNGDQFKQTDKRVLSGFNLRHAWSRDWGGREVENTVGLQVRNDNIGVGLFSTRARQVLATTRDDHVLETSAGLYFQNTIRWNEHFRSIAGLRGDFFRADVSSDTAVNSGKSSDRMVSPKLGLVFGPWARTEYYLNYGRGFHSNDARGTTITVDPATGAPADRVPLLVRTTGYEGGVRYEMLRGLQSSFSLFRLDFDSELLFVGDAGTTEPSRPSRRTGFEWSNLYTPNGWLEIDADIAFTKARFSDSDPAGNRVPGAVEGVATLTVTVDHRGPWYGSARLRYFGPRPLIEDNSVRSQSATLLSGRIGYRFDRKLRLQVDGFNLLNKEASQISYFYDSRLPGEGAAGVSDVHLHPTEPRSFRVSLITTF